MLTDYRHTASKFVRSHHARLKGLSKVRL